MKESSESGSTIQVAITFMKNGNMLSVFKEPVPSSSMVSGGPHNRISYSQLLQEFHTE